MVALTFSQPDGLPFILTAHAREEARLYRAFVFVTCGTDPGLAFPAPLNRHTLRPDTIQQGATPNATSKLR